MGCIQTLSPSSTSAVADDEGVVQQAQGRNTNKNVVSSPRSLVKLMNMVPKTTPTTEKSTSNAKPETMNVLMIGAGDSGKTTICKQLLSLHASQFDDQAYRETFAAGIVGNVLDGTLQVLNRMDDKDKDPYKSIRENIQNEARTAPKFLSPTGARMISDLYYKDDRFKQTIATKADAVQLHDCYEYFCMRLKDYPQWLGRMWVPSKDDCVRSRARTSGVTMYDIELQVRSANASKTVLLNLTDVGGQRAERRKWMNVPSVSAKVSMLVFVVALSEYNQALFEDRRKNRLEESLDLFAECVNSDWLKKVPVTLFFNKKDLFDRKFLVDKIPLNVSGRFPDAPKQNDNPNEAIDWLARKFSQRRERKATIPVHVMTATDGSSVRAVFAHCTEMLLQRSLRQNGTKRMIPTLTSIPPQDASSSLSLASSAGVSEESLLGEGDHKLN